MSNLGFGGSNSPTGNNPFSWNQQQPVSTWTNPNALKAPSLYQNAKTSAANPTTMNFAPPPIFTYNSSLQPQNQSQPFQSLQQPQQQPTTPVQSFGQSQQQSFFQPQKTSFVQPQQQSFVQPQQQSFVQPQQQSFVQPQQQSFVQPQQQSFVQPQQQSFVQSQQQSFVQPQQPSFVQPQQQSLVQPQQQSLVQPQQQSFVQPQQQSLVQPQQQSFIQQPFKFSSQLTQPQQTLLASSPAPQELFQQISELLKLVQQYQQHVFMQQFPTPPNYHDNFLKNYGERNSFEWTKYHNSSAQPLNGVPMNSPIPCGRASSLALNDLANASEANQKYEYPQWSAYNSFGENRVDDMKWKYPALSASSSHLLPEHPLTRRRGSTCLSKDYHPEPVRSVPSSPVFRSLPDRDTKPLTTLWRRNDHYPGIRRGKWNSVYDDLFYDNACNPKRRCDMCLGMHHPTSGLDSEIARKWNRLDDSVVRSLEYRHARQNACSSPPWGKIEPVGFFDMENSRCKALLGARGPPLDSDQTIRTEKRGIGLAKILSNFPEPKEKPKIVANLPQRVEIGVPTPPKSILKSNSNFKDGNTSIQNQNSANSVSRTSPIHFAKSGSKDEPKKKVRFVLDSPTQTHRFEDQNDSRDLPETNKADAKKHFVKLLKDDEHHYNPPAPPYLRGGPKIGQMVDNREDEGSMRHQQSNDLNSSESPQADTDSLRNSGETLETLHFQRDPVILKPGCMVQLTRPGYYCIPDLQTLDSLANPETGDCLVEEFEIGHEEHGKVVFDGFINVCRLNLDEIIHFSPRMLELYPSNMKKPPFNCGLHRPCTVTLNNIWPVNRSDRTGTEVIKEKEQIVKLGYENNLRRACEKFGGTFLSYDPKTGKWIFRIQENPIKLW